MPDFAQARRTMVDCQIRTFDVTDLRVLAAMDETSRELYVPEAQLALAYSDRRIEFEGPGGARRWLLRPMVLARLIQALGIRQGETVLDVACATGYGSALLSRLGARVTALEADAGLAASAEAALRQDRVNVTVAIGPAAAGHLSAAPFDAILVNGAFEVPPHALLGQVCEGGRLVGIDAGVGAGQAVLLRRSGQGFSRRALFDCAAPTLEGLRRAPEFVF